MVHHRLVGRCLLALALVAVAAVPAGATTLMRASLGDLVEGNATIVSARVLGFESYWNAEGTFILTDVRVLASDTLKGDPGQREFRITVMGGTVGDITTLIPGGPDMEVGKDYVLFLNREELPGVRDALTIRELSQGIFDVVDTATGPRAVSQATRHPLVADRTGNTEAAGGAAGFSMNELAVEVRRLAAAR
jgi:hypothetical protein